jgi:DNA-directed RNA polymerase specialized sigma24 family protein
MRTVANNVNSLPAVYLTVVDSDAGTIETKIRKHSDLLKQIACGLGFNSVESHRIVEDVFLQAKDHYIDYHGTYQFKVWLAKILVRKCIFNLSTDLFNSVSNMEVTEQAAGNYSTLNDLCTNKEEQMPLSCWVVYILNKVTGFSEIEIGEILNISSIKVRERLNKGLLLIAKVNKKHFGRSYL